MGSRQFQNIYVNVRYIRIYSIEFYLGSQTRLIFAFILTEEFWKNCFRRHAVWSQRDVDMKNEYPHPVPTLVRLSRKRSHISLVWQHSFAGCTCKNQVIGYFRHLVMVFCTFDISFTVEYWLVYPMYENTVLVRGHGIFRSRPGASIYIAAWEIALPILAFNFGYRKLAITSFFINYYILAPDDISLHALDPLFQHFRQVSNTRKTVFDVTSSETNGTSTCKMNVRMVISTLKNPKNHCYEEL
ncbi:hypothetical protein PRIPAC_86139 [Pristionchus pacificus]|uniref:Uncharacterized protein n=1 Tax=Pristionchus pacificus TaxID=54126 RepID=A0A2A6BU61_PRIPA|nr:hypothetical protein PRIPAC_86139 [Pristionchus pacificus]|eukprot:PDM69346.1 hypothetical protein PRIPAC_47648 [Pristionchus pacificus]